MAATVAMATLLRAFGLVIYQSFTFKTPSQIRFGATSVATVFSLFLHFVICGFSSVQTYG